VAETRKVCAVPIYVLIEENSVVLPTAKLEYVTPKQLPEEGNFFVLTAEGLCKNVDTGIVKALTPVKSIDVLANFRQIARLKLPKIPRLILARAKTFFQRVYEKLHSESELMLLYQEHNRQFDLWCPEQRVSFGGVDYKLSEEMQSVSNAGEFRVVGTIHSHANFGAFHSGTDLNDESHGFEDGVHITIGHVDRDEFSLSCSVAIGGKRWKVPQENVLLGVERGTGEVRRYGMNATTSDAFYRFTYTEEERIAMDGEIDRQIEEEWMPRVKKETYHQKGGWQGGGVVYVRGEDDFDFLEDEEGGEWQLRGKSWVFVSDEQLVEEEKDRSIAEAGGVKKTTKHPKEDQ
jgi:proteasome lid subunit RPN8/RPN11